MAKHLSVEEKINAEEEFKRNKEEITYLRKHRKSLIYLSQRKRFANNKDNLLRGAEESMEKIRQLQTRNKKLQSVIYWRSKSPYKGLFSARGECYKMFGKTKSELTVEECREYDKFMRAKLRKKKKREIEHEHEAIKHVKELLKDGKPFYIIEKTEYDKMVKAVEEIARGILKNLEDKSNETS